MKKAIIIMIFCLVAAILISLIVVSVSRKDPEFTDTVKYNGKTYVLLEYNADIFVYYHNSNSYFDEDIISPVSHNVWDMVYSNGDLYIAKEDIEEATEYYKDDVNYSWYVLFETEEDEIKVPVLLSNNEIKYLYNIEKVETRETAAFEEIQEFADIVKESHDGTVFGITNLVRYEDSWYWKTEIMTNNNEEYIIKLPDSLNAKILKAAA